MKISVSQKGLEYLKSEFIERSKATRRTKSQDKSDDPRVFRIPPSKILRSPKSNRHNQYSLINRNFERKLSKFSFSSSMIFSLPKKVNEQETLAPKKLNSYKLLKESIRSFGEQKSNYLKKRIGTIEASVELKQKLLRISESAKRDLKAELKLPSLSARNEKLKDSIVLMTRYRKNGINYKEYFEELQQVQKLSKVKSTFSKSENHHSLTLSKLKKRLEASKQSPPNSGLILMSEMASLNSAIRTLLTPRQSPQKPKNGAIAPFRFLPPSPFPKVEALSLSSHIGNLSSRTLKDAFN